MTQLALPLNDSSLPATSIVDKDVVSSFMERLNLEKIGQGSVSLVRKGSAPHGYILGFSPALETFFPSPQVVNLLDEVVKKEFFQFLSGYVGSDYLGTIWAPPQYSLRQGVGSLQLSLDSGEKWGGGIVLNGFSKKIDGVNEVVRAFRSHTLSSFVYGSLRAEVETPSSYILERFFLE